jgi:hypothetical protein
MFTGLSKTFDVDGYADGSLTFEKAGTIDIDFFVEVSSQSRDGVHDEKRGHTQPDHADHH